MSPLFFNAERKLKGADEDLKRGLFYDAMRGYKEILKKEKQNTFVIGQADAGLRKAREGLVGLQTEEAKKYLAEGDKVQAAECCRNAIDLAGSDLRAREAKEILNSILPDSFELDGESDDGLRHVPSVETTEDESRSPEEISSEDLFQLYLNSLPEERAEILTSLGPSFRDGYLLAQQGKGEEALQSFGEAPETTAAHPLFRFYTAQTLFSCGHDKEALEALEDLQLPDDLMLVRAEMRAILYWRLEQPDKAGAEARWLYSHASEDVNAAYLYAQILASGDRPREALETLAPWVDPVQVIPQIDRMVIQLSLELGQVDDALELLERAMKRYFHDSMAVPPEAQVAQTLGMGLHGGRGFPFDESSQTSETFPLWAGRQLLDLYIEHDDGPEAVEELAETLIMFDPESEVEYRDRLNRYLESTD